MKHRLFLTIILLGTTPCMGLASQAAMPKQSAQTKKNAKELQLLDKAWALRKETVSKKLAFTEKLLKDFENQNHTAENRSRLLLATALVLLSEENTQMASAELISEAAKIAPLKLNRTAAQFIWNDILKRIPSETSSGLSALTDVAAAIASDNQSEINESHTYFLALSKNQQGSAKDALSLFAKIETSSKFYRQAKLQEGLIHARDGNIARAKVALETVLSLEKTDVEKKAGLGDQFLIDVKERAVLNLARLHFESKEFKESISLYRSIDSQSPLFYESLSEQGWAFFMAGHPNRALGVGYGATSPHYNQQFQPDQYFLNASVNYWLCDFPAARKSIQSFVMHTRDDGQLLRRWGDSASPKARDTDSERLQKAFKIVEGLAQGVTHSNNLLGPRSLQTLGRKRSLINGIDELATLRADRMKLLGSAWPLQSKKTLIDALLNLEKKEQRRIGKLALSIIDAMRSDYERSLAQMRLIHLEIMTAEKDKLMKSGRSAEGQQFTGSEQDFLESAEGSARIWEDNKREFWKDELDSFVFNKKSECNTDEEERKHAVK